MSRTEKLSYHRCHTRNQMVVKAEIEVEPDTYENFMLSKTAKPFRVLSNSGFAKAFTLACRKCVNDIDAENNDTVIACASAAGQLGMVRHFISLGADTEIGDMPPLAAAAMSGHENVVKYLVKKANVNGKTVTEDTALTLASKNGHTLIVDILIKNHADLEHKDCHGCTPLMNACRAGHVHVVRMLLQSGAKVNNSPEAEDDGEITLTQDSALSLAIENGHENIVSILIHNTADLEHKDGRGRTPLMRACRAGHEGVVKLLIENGANVNYVTEADFVTPLCLAIMYEAPADYLWLKSHALVSEDCVNQRPAGTKETAIALASAAGHLQVVQYLIEHGAQTDIGNIKPLAAAAMEGRTKVVSYLLEVGADVNEVIPTKDSALSLASQHGHVETVDILIRNNANIEQNDYRGKTPLMKACRAGHFDMVELLVQNGANVNSVSTANKYTPLSMACTAGNVKIVKLLLNAGADINHRLRRKRTMLMVAAAGGNIKCGQELVSYFAKH